MMHASKKAARAAGILYVIGTVSGVLSMLAAGFSIRDPRYLSLLAEEKSMVLWGVFFLLTMGMALALVPVVLFPVFRRKNEALAMAYVVFRGALETVGYMGIAVCWLLLLGMSQRYAGSSPDGAAALQMMGTLIQDAAVKCGLMLENAFLFGALLINYLFYTTRLIPRWLSSWGLLGVCLYFVHLITLIVDNEVGVLMAPLAVQEMAMAGWLIIKGFHPAALIALGVEDVNRNAPDAAQ